MKGQLFTALLLAALAGNVHGGFPEDFQAAMKLRPAEAAPRFEQLAEQAPEGAKNRVLMQAGLNYVKAGKLADAERVALRLQGSAGKLLKMQILYKRKSWKDIAELYRNEDLSKWADAEQYDAFRLRGEAFFWLAQYDKAGGDLRQAVQLSDLPLEKAAVLNSLARCLLKQNRPEDAVAEYRKVLAFEKLKGFGHYNSACLGIAEILAARKQYAEALQEIARIPRPKSGYWAYKPLEAEADILMKMGKTAEAAQKRGEAEALKKR